MICEDKHGVLVAKPRTLIALCAECFSSHWHSRGQFLRACVEHENVVLVLPVVESSQDQDGILARYADHCWVAPSWESLGRKFDLSPAVLRSSHI